MVGDVGGEGLQCATGQARGSVGVPAGPAAVDEVADPVYLLDEEVVDSAVGEVVEELAQSGQTVQAGTALAGAVFGEITEDVCGVREATFVAPECVNDACARTGPQRCEGGLRQPDAGQRLGRDPTAVVTADEDRTQGAMVAESEPPGHVGQQRSGGLFDDASLVQRTRQRDEHGAWLRPVTDRAEPSGSVPGDQGDVGECLDVVDQRGPAPHTGCGGEELAVAGA